ncbi:thiol reductant ABC exporter subunit CydD [Bacillus piscicola]|uniref:thiol reductant ABC exporter subunit CydD n=1 Tax=Bacillus piscicola TaxID=1632684 RepID=UPI001F0992E3|nr:thiol reductant ABC exporter subunit CydD [Bacillus piscicola]
MKKQRVKKLPNYPGSLKTHSLLTIFILCEAVAIIAQAYFLARAITFLFDRMPIGEVIPDIGFFFVAFVIRYLITHIEMAAADKYAAKSAQMLRDRLMQTYFGRSHAFVRQIGIGHLVTLAMEGVDHVKRYVEIIGVRMIKTAVIPAFIVIFVFLYDPISSVILVLAVPIIVIFMILLGLAAQMMADRQYETYTRLSNHFIDSLKGLETLAYLGKSREHAKKIEQVSGDYRNATMRTLRVAFLSTFALDFFTSLSIAFVAVGLGLRLIEGDITLLPALTILILAPEYFSPIKQVGKDYHATLDGQLAMQEIDNLISTEESRQTNEQTELFDWQQDSVLTFDKVTVGIAEKKLLDDLRFNIRTGWNGIIGASGSGKSTLINVLAGLLLPTDGSIQINDQPVSSLKNESWFEQIAYIPQAPYVFPLSLADNIRFYALDASDEEVQQMIQEIGLEDLVRSFPAGIHEKIGEGGRSISGGQEQRIAIARALLSGKPVILLDEPTAHLDIETEYEIKQLMLRVFKDKFVILATHRLHWLKQLDHILFLESGELKHQGTHEQLMNQSGNYVSFVRWGKEESG